MIAQLQGRERGARALRVEGRRAEWIVFACLHSAVFIRDQRSRFLDEHPEQVRRGVHALIARGMAVNEMARVEEAILQGDGWVLGEYDGLQAAMKRSVVLKKQARQPARPGTEPPPAVPGKRRASPGRTSDDRSTSHATTGM